MNPSQEASRKTPVYGWVMLAVAWFALLLSAADRSLWATTAPVAAEDLGLSPALALGAFVTATQAGYIFALLTGALATDRYGPRRMLAIALAFLGLALFGFGQARGFTHGLVAQFCIGMGAAPVFAIGLKLVVNWFAPERRATAVSLFMSALPLPTILVNLLAPIGIGLLGWRGNYTAVAGLTLVSALLFAFMVRDRPGPAQPVLSLKQLSPLPLLRSHDFRCIVIANMAAPCATWGFMVWANLMLMDRYALPLRESGAIVATYGLGGLAGLLLSGPLCERLKIDRRQATLAGFLVFAVALIGVGSIRDLSLMRIAIPLLGLAAYAYAPLLNTLLANKAVALAASAAGMATVLTFAAEGLQPLLIGLVYTRTGSFFAVCAALAAGPVIAAIAIASMARSPVNR